MSLENVFLTDLDGSDPDGFVNSLDRRTPARIIKDFLSSFGKPKQGFWDLPEDLIVEKENKEH